MCGWCVPGIKEFLEKPSSSSGLLSCLCVFSHPHLHLYHLGTFSKKKKINKIERERKEGKRRKKKGELSLLSCLEHIL